MKFGRYISELIYGKEAIGLELIIRGDDNYQAIFTKVFRKADNLIIQESWQREGSLEEIFDGLNVKLPYFASFSGKGIIIRQVNKKDDLRAVFPNMNLDELVVQEFENMDDSKFVSLIRKQQLNDILNVFEQKKLFLPKLILGPFSVLDTLGAFTFESTINTKMYELRVSNGVLLTVNSLSGEQNLETDLIPEEKITNFNLLSFSSSIDFTQAKYNKTFNESIYTLNGEAYKFKHLLRIFFYTVLGISFMALLINYFVFSNKSKVYNQYSFQLNKNMAQVKRLEGLKKEELKKREFLESTGIIDQSFFSFYSDKIGQTVPEKIRLTELVVFPVSKRIKINEQIDYGEIIKVSGYSIASEILNLWIKQLTREDWVKEIKINSYLFDAKANEGLFEIEIYLKE